MAIEAKDFTEKDELIAQFYTLRAGLSVIAEEMKYIRDLENSKNNLVNQDREHREKVAHLLFEKKWRVEKEFEKEIKTTKSKIEDLRRKCSGEAHELKKLQSPTIINDRIKKSPWD